ncbi:MAG: fumarylacetoacetate hydrolase, partial [Sphingomonas bacterium]|nr:fumarylacetoacetate hydrolase [Sphingomonas bacterium]
MKTGFGWIQAKPACSVAPFAVTPDELGDAWRDGRVCLDLSVDWNGVRFGNANGGPMALGFHDLIAHAARTRALPPGTIIGSGTMSNPDYRAVGSSCIAERREIEMIDEGRATHRLVRRFAHKRSFTARIAGVFSSTTIPQRVSASPKPGKVAPIPPRPEADAALPPCADRPPRGI